MHKFPIYEYKTFAELPLDRFNSFRFSVYLLDFKWNFLFLNSFARATQGERANDLIGKNMWTVFPELATDPAFINMKERIERRITCKFETMSPVTRRRVSITAYPLEDCYYFTSSILPDKDELLNEIRSQLKKK